MEMSTRSPRRFSPLRTLQDEVNELFESVFPDRRTDGDDAPSARWSPRMDVTETDDQYRLSVDLPGLSKDDLSITVDDNRLTIRGERKEERRTDGENVVRRERTFGRFYRTLRLPASVDEQNIDATFEDGILSVNLPKAEKSTTKNIAIS